MLLATTTTRFAALFRDGSNLLFDPGSVLLVIEAPDGTRTEYLYGEDAELVRDSTGSYRANLNLTSAGTWLWRWECGGSLKAAHEGKLVVRASQLTSV